ncbi:hypothetical protein [Streptomyces sp. NPDC054784]
MSTRTLPGAAAVLVTAAAVLLAGCSGGGDGDDGKDGGAGERPSAASTATAGTGGGDGTGTEDGEGAEEPGRDEAAKGPKVPEAELTPATGSFSKKQKKYLVDRVPEGMDPAAILEAGTAACDRIGTTADADREAAVSALKEGEIANAEAAVDHLCPEYEPLLKAAGLK